MEKTKVVEWVDIKAPRSEVFDLILNLERRMQLSPLWGITRPKELGPDFPAVGSRYSVEVKKEEEEEEYEYETVVTELIPGRKFAYCLEVEMATEVSWTLLDTQEGSRITYQETFQNGQEFSEEMDQQVRQIVRQWLQNIRRYAELREGRLNHLVKWVLDRYFLKLRQDQRKVILLLLVMQITGIISFAMAALAFGLISLFQ